MTRKEFFLRVGFAASGALIPACIGGLATSCSSNPDATAPVQLPKAVDFTVEVSSGALSINGGFLVLNEIITARTLIGEFIAVSVACTHQFTNVDYISGSNSFICSNHGSQFASDGIVTKGPADRNLTKYRTTLSGTILRIFS
jgi:cytochrome b6-f complex iron-sulfur subunit